MQGRTVNGYLVSYSVRKPRMDIPCSTSSKRSITTWTRRLMALTEHRSWILRLSKTGKQRYPVEGSRTDRKTPEPAGWGSKQTMEIIVMDGSAFKRPAAKIAGKRNIKTWRLRLGLSGHWHQLRACITKTIPYQNPCTENREMSWCQLCCQWWHRRWSLWQATVPQWQQSRHYDNSGFSVY